MPLMPIQSTFLNLKATCTIVDTIKHIVATLWNWSCLSWGRPKSKFQILILPEKANTRIIEIVAMSPLDVDAASV